MHRKVKPASRKCRLIGQFPHCDQRVLHAPGECQFCDKHPQWQELREAWGIAFTGYDPDANELPCPATLARPVAKIHAWGGNRPFPENAL